MTNCLLWHISFRTSLRLGTFGRLRPIFRVASSIKRDDEEDDEPSLATILLLVECGEYILLLLLFTIDDAPHNVVVVGSCSDSGCGGWDAGEGGGTAFAVVAVLGTAAAMEANSGTMLCSRLSTFTGATTKRRDFERGPRRIIIFSKVLFLCVADECTNVPNQKKYREARDCVKRQKKTTRQRLTD